MLDVIHCRIRPRRQIGDRLNRPLCIENRNTNRNTKRFIGRTGINAQSPRCRNQTCRPFLCNTVIRAVHPHGKFVASEPSDKIAGAGLRDEEVSECDERFVAALMAVDIVHSLEIIEIDIKQ